MASERRASEGLTHLDEDGKARMVDVGEKRETHRLARASGRVYMKRATRDAIAAGDVPKGEVFGVARIAGIQAAKRCGELIPLCHPLRLDHVDVDFSWGDDGPDGESYLEITTKASVAAKTGVEMEALTAASVAALTVYDMCKAIDREMRIDRVVLLEKQGGKSSYRRADD